MSYKNSMMDVRNSNWFKSNLEVKSLVGIELLGGNIRSLYPTKLEFSYPITAIAGENGSGKSTVLALAACAFHNHSKGIVPDERKTPYYTFSDFFMQTGEEVPPDGIIIKNIIRSNKWKGSKQGDLPQFRSKKKGGKWNKYDKRAKRNVFYFGTLRIVTTNELRTHKSYRRYFAPTSDDSDNCNRIIVIASKIFGKMYDEFHICEHGKYTVPVVSSSNCQYSGFNMGAGEKSVFSILHTIFRSGKGALLVIDEIELGLHAKAQRLFVEELKKLCLKFKCQIICSTHSPIILSSLPPEGRIYIEKLGEKTDCIHGISPEYAIGKLSGLSSNELTIYTEDIIAGTVIENILPHKVRQRIKIYEIGSDEAVAKQMASQYRRNDYNFIGILDGDKKSQNEQIVDRIKKHLEDRTPQEIVDFKKHCGQRLNYLPGDQAPEKELMTQILSNTEYHEYLMDKWSIELDPLINAMKSAMTEDTHDILHELSQYLHIDKIVLLIDIVKSIQLNNHKYFEYIVEYVTFMLEATSRNEA